jgi:MFS family permease
VFTLFRKKTNPKPVNTVIWLLTVNDIFTWGVFYVVVILIGLYLSLKLDIVATELVGLGTGLMYMTRALVQIPLGILGDRLKSDRDELWFLMIGNVLMGIPVILFTQITAGWQYLALQMLIGVGAAMNIVDWRKLFAKNLDKGREGMEYAIYDSLMSFSIAMLGIFSGAVANISEAYFDLVIGGIGVLIIVSNIWILLIYILQRNRLAPT